MYLKMKVVLESHGKIFSLVLKIFWHNWMAHECYCEFL